MPRTGRFTVEFTVQEDDDPSKIWLAEFVHQHAKEDCPHIDVRTGKAGACYRPACSHYDHKGRPDHLPWTCPQPRKRGRCLQPHITPVPWNENGHILQLRHLTVVKLRYKGDNVFVKGEAPCSMADEYSPRKGIHLALQRALEKRKFCRLHKLATAIDGVAAGTLVAVDKTPMYDAVMEAFYREMRIRPARGGGSVTAAVVPSEARVALVGAMDARRRDHGMGAVEHTDPPMYPHGTYCMGAD